MKITKVGELIEELKKYDPDFFVVSTSKEITSAHFIDVIQAKGQEGDKKFLIPMIELQQFKNEVRPSFTIDEKGKNKFILLEEKEKNVH